MKYPDNSASTYYPLSEALFSGDPSGYLSTGFADTGRGISFTVASGGSAFTNLWDSAHIVWRVKRQLDGSYVPYYSAAGVPDWSRAMMEIEGVSAIADTEPVYIQLLLIGAPAGATTLSDISSASPSIAGGGLGYGNASGPDFVTSTGSGGGASSGTRSTATEACRIEALTGVAPLSDALSISRVRVEGCDLDGQRPVGGAIRDTTSSQNLLSAANDELYLMLSILKTGSATGGAGEYALRTRIDTRGTLA